MHKRNEHEKIIKIKDNASPYWVKLHISIFIKSNEGQNQLNKFGTADKKVTQPDNVRSISL